MENTKKKVIFFDGDGTLWYPKETRHTVVPWWIYEKEGSPESKLDQIILVPGAQEMLEILNSAGVKVVILSTHPQHLSIMEAQDILMQKVRHFDIENLCDEIYATRHYHAAKGEKIIEVLQRHDLPRSAALMLGDHYKWDYESAQDVGVDALLIESEYMKDYPNNEEREILEDLNSVLKYTA